MKPAALSLPGMARALAALLNELKIRARDRRRPFRGSGFAREALPRPQGRAEAAGEPQRSAAALQWHGGIAVSISGEAGAALSDCAAAVCVVGRSSSRRPDAAGRRLAHRQAGRRTLRAPAEQSGPCQRRPGHDGQLGPCRDSRAISAGLLRPWRWWSAKTTKRSCPPMRKKRAHCWRTRTSDISEASAISPMRSGPKSSPTSSWRKRRQRASWRPARACAPLLYTYSVILC